MTCVTGLADGDPARSDPDGPGPFGREYRVRLSEVRYGRSSLSIRRDFARTPQDRHLVFVAGRRAEAGEPPKPIRVAACLRGASADGGPSASTIGPPFTTSYHGQSN